MGGEGAVTEPRSLNFITLTLTSLEHLAVPSFARLKSERAGGREREKCIDDICNRDLS